MRMEHCQLVNTKLKLSSFSFRPATRQCQCTTKRIQAACSLKCCRRWGALRVMILYPSFIIAHCSCTTLTIHVKWSGAAGGWRQNRLPTWSNSPTPTFISNQVPLIIVNLDDRINICVHLVTNRQNAAATKKLQHGPSKWAMEKKMRPGFYVRVLAIVAPI